MDNDFEGVENLDVLQNMEFAIVSALETHPDMVDTDVMCGLDAAIRNLRDLERGRIPREPNLDAVTAEIFHRVMGICFMRMRRAAIADGGAGCESADGIIPESALLPAATISRCLKKIRKSVDNWHGVGGRRGYLEFILPYFSSKLADGGEADRIGGRNPIR
jgi:hypothetical protein